MSAKQYWIGFNLVKGIGAVRLQNLLDYFGSLEIAWQAPADGLRAAGLSQRLVENLLQVRQGVDLDKILAQFEQQGIQVLTWEDETYPRRLKEIDQPPPVIYLRGDLRGEDELSVAIVGTRRATAYGRQVTEEIATFLAQNGITVISGLARGIDTFAHQAAVNAGGRTLAVLGCGVDIIYPPENRRLGEQILSSGALVSDYAPGTQPDGPNFPPRNRIISGLSLATVVIEAGNTSGALITATFAAEQGREVFGVPGNIHAPQSQGVNRLLQQGAHVLLKPQDLMDVLNLGQAQEHQAARKVLPVDATEARLIHIIALEPLHLDEISARSGLSIDQVSATLAIMELKGMVRQVGGMNYQAVHEDRSDYRLEGD